MDSCTFLHGTQVVFWTGVLSLPFFAIVGAFLLHKHGEISTAARNFFLIIFSIGFVGGGILGLGATYIFHVVC